MFPRVVSPLVRPVPPTSLLLSSTSAATPVCAGTGQSAGQRYPPPPHTHTFPLSPPPLSRASQTQSASDGDGHRPWWLAGVQVGGGELSPPPGLPAVKCGAGCGLGGIHMRLSLSG